MKTPTKIDTAQANKIIETLVPRGCFYFYDKKANVFVGIDNSTGHAWVEEFATLEECLNWLGSRE